MHHIFCTIVLQLFLRAPGAFGVPYTRGAKTKVIAPMAQPEKIEPIILRA